MDGKNLYIALNLNLACNLKVFFHKSDSHTLKYLTQINTKNILNVLKEVDRDALKS